MWTPRSSDSVPISSSAAVGRALAKYSASSGSLSYSRKPWPLKVIRSRALTYDAMREANVIFLGSPWANELQDKVNPGQTPLICNNEGRIVNSDPQPGEQAYYALESDPATQALKVSYSLIRRSARYRAGDQDREFGWAGHVWHFRRHRVPHFHGGRDGVAGKVRPSPAAGLAGVLSSGNPNGNRPGRPGWFFPRSGSRGEKARLQGFKGSTLKLSNWAIT